ncbi:hypothetical protein EA658_13945 [Pseudoxanthomonas winnipegensis]|uniref:Uncharacterized protein n=2 Tax=Pseudoxanthomonas winnipegensis TaxID=2480810 RepID=A0ABY1WCI7_9GAMM|nr:hypothetical protein [Pseudoxanthomonas winnipegensis]TAA18738.1 hypothetical protein EA658_13945 [Pseudoxanthomonas winnipegensis]
MGERVLQFSDLQELCRPGERPRLSTVVRWADENGIRYKYDANGGIWTTLAALDAALSVSAANAGAAVQPYDAGELFGRKR